MTNRAIARLFRELSMLMEYHGENAFKIRSYQTAYNNFRRLDQPIIEMDAEARSQLAGVGKAIAEKLDDILETGTFDTLERFRANTPAGIREMLQIRGIGPKKLKALINNLGVSTPGELLYACQENRLVDIKGFGAKTQANIQKALSYHQESRGKLLYRDALVIDALVRERWSTHLDESPQSLSPAQAPLIAIGDLGRKRQIIEEIRYMTSTDATGMADDLWVILSADDDRVHYQYDERVDVIIDVVADEDLVRESFFQRCDEDLAEEIWSAIDSDDPVEEEEIFELADISYIPAECREYPHLETYARIEELIHREDIRGVVHNHSTWSDGSATIKQMAERCIAEGHSYFGISDHSQAAFYAGGLKPDQVYAQWEEIDQLNDHFADQGFRILKGIESDILADGSLDYEDSVLAGFDFVVASIHSSLQMDEQKATRRLITAIENPYTSILGHPTGRLLLARPAYPIDYAKVIDACAANGVHLELNANPLRLDIDWSWIGYAMEREVMISINPDAHSPDGLMDLEHGLVAARKGLLTADLCLNALSADAMVEVCKR